MKTLAKLLAAATVVASTLCFAQTASATTYSLWIHGRSSTPSAWSYWSHSGWANNSVGDVGVNPIAVNYDGTAHISSTNPGVVAALDTYCKGGNSCYVACHSAGCAQIGYAVAYNQPMRWNIIWVLTAGSAEGGSELANAGSWLTGWDIDSDLHVSTMRGMYNHDLVGDQIEGYMYNYLGGDWSSLTNVFFPCNSSFLGVCYSWAANDSVVAFHSSGRFRSSGGYQSDSNTTETTGGSYWDWSRVLFADANNGSYGHCINGGFLGSCQEGGSGGIVGVESGTMNAYAK